MAPLLHLDPVFVSQILALCFLMRENEAPMRPLLRTKLCDRPEVQEYSEERRPSEKSASLFPPSPAIAELPLVTLPYPGPSIMLVNDG